MVVKIFRRLNIIWKVIKDHISKRTVAPFLLNRVMKLKDEKPY